jgi:hypothetical protein
MTINADRYAPEFFPEVSVELALVMLSSKFCTIFDCLAPSFYWPTNLQANGQPIFWQSIAAAAWQYQRCARMKLRLRGATTTEQA